MRLFLALLRYASIAAPRAAKRIALAIFLLPCAGLSAFAAESPGSMLPIDPHAYTGEASLQSAPDIVFGLFLGIMVTAALYLFFIWIVLRERGQIFLMFLLVSLGLNVASTNDSFVHLLDLQNATMVDLLQNYSMISAYIFGLLFTANFLEIDINARIMRFPFGIFLSLLTALLIVTAIDQRPAAFVLPTLGALSVGLALAAGLLSLWRGVSGSLSHLTAFSFFLMGGMAPSLHDLNYIVGEAASQNMTYAGFSMATIMFAIVIAGQFAARQEEKEKALQLSNERFSLAARGSNEGLFEWNRVTGEVYFSGQFRRILGVALESNPRGLKEWLRLIQPRDRQHVFATLRKFRNHPSAATVNLEYRIARGAAGSRWIHTKAVATRDAATGEIARFVGSIGDVTEQKRSEAKLRASEARFRSITEAHPVPVLIVGLEKGEIFYASPGAEKLIGLPGGMLIDHKIDRFLPFSGERREIIEALQAGQDVNMKEIVVARGDGENVPAALSARRINYQNEPAMVLGLYDLTEKKLAEKQIAQQQEALQQSEKMAALGGLLAGVAHELNNPLSVVMGQTTLLMEGPGEDKTKKRADKIFKAADRCSRIVKSFLALARRKPPERKEIALNPIIHNSLELLGYQFRNENVVLKLELDETLPPVIGDEDQMTQVFTNLALNAAQAMHEWQGPHELTIRSETEDSKTVRLTFADTGPGIPAEIRAKVFEPFFTTKGGTGGTGVGLSLCLNIVEGHGGRIQIEETEGGGATFTIWLPVSTGVRAAQMDAPDLESMPQRKLRILLVDDEIELAQTLADLLEPLGHDIDLAANGAIAFEKIEKTGCDVIISDLRMPVLDGPGLYAALAEKKPEYTKKIIYVTGDTLSPHVHAFLSKTPVPVIEKPYRLVDVQTALAKLLKENETQSNIGGVDSAHPSPA